MGEMDPRESLRRTIRQVRRRWRLRVALRGASIALAAALLLFLVSAWGLEQFRYTPAALIAFRAFAYLGALGLLLRFLVLPLLSSASDEQVALYVERHEPSLDAALLSAVEAAPQAAAGDARVSPALVERLVEDAMRRCEQLEYGRFVERRRLGRFASLLAGVAGAGMLAALLSPAFVRQAAPYLLSPWRVRAASPYTIAVEPGHATIARGADQTVVARLSGFDAETVEIASLGADGGWTRAAMAPDEEGAWRHMLLAVGAPTDYYVEAAGVRSEVYRLSVADLARAVRIEIEYRFPGYTGLAPQKIEDGGDVAALRGTEVRLRVTPNLRVASGRLAVDAAPATPLTLEADGRLAGSFVLEKPGFYRIELPASDGTLRAASPDYVIEVLDDQPPAVSFVKPGRDTQVTPLDEVFAEVKAEDDFGVSSVELVYSVNGGPEQTRSLHAGAARLYVSAGHTFFLEEHDLKPGDFVSYYARVRDGRAPKAQAASTDIYFLEARPFKRDYRQAEQGGMPGQGGQQDGALSEQQRQVVAATFKLTRDRERTPQKTWGESVATVALAEGKLRGQVDELLTRMSMRVLQPGSSFHETAGELRSALAEMQAAEEQLKRRDPQQALAPAQRALLHLQRAEGSFRDVRVAMGDSAGGQGGGPEAEELADLFELELDKLRNQYETLQRGEKQKADEAVDEALARLRELAQRQQQENERRRANAGRASGQGGASQRELAEQAEELGRRLERLARERSSGSIEETARRLKEAADAMRRTAASERSGQPGEGASALDRLRDAQRLLDQGRGARLDRDLKEAQRKAAELRAAQDRIASDVKEMAESGAAAGDRGARVGERKQAMGEEVAELEAQLDRLSRETRRERKEAARKLQEAADAIRDDKLKEKIRFTQGLVQNQRAQQAQALEEAIASDLAGLEKRLQEAQAASEAGRGEDQRRAQALDGARRLAQDMESLGERLRERAGGRRADGQPADRQQAAGGGITPGGTAPGFGPGERRQLQRELRERLGEARELDRALDAAGRPADLEPILRKMSGLENRIGDPKGLAQLAASVAEDLKLLEYVLRRQAQGAGQKPVLTDSDALPPGWRALVEEYYRALARDGKR
ncbi:MAG: DUF4175 family protein [Vicinamibacteria bacterium]